MGETTKKALYLLAWAAVKVYSWAMLQVGEEKKVCFYFLVIIWFNTKTKIHEMLWNLGKRINKGL